MKVLVIVDIIHHSSLAHPKVSFLDKSDNFYDDHYGQPASSLIIYKEVIVLIIIVMMAVVVVNIVNIVDIDIMDMMANIVLVLDYYLILMMTIKLMVMMVMMVMMLIFSAIFFLADRGLYPEFILSLLLYA
uniref:Uncharacterized protein n=1 Tax=Rhizophagus irregularis (strain DAOM 181602 / DAOM 197198 / MUCL 43194) TaxID=747089 RepID=U9T6N7_RHIID